jgi:hypothetical protein
LTDSFLRDACGHGELVAFADLGEIPVLRDVHRADQVEAAGTGVGLMDLAHCPSCAYVRKVAFDPERHHHERLRRTRRIAELVDEGATRWLWGSGPRGVRFLTLANRDRKLSAVVDLNPGKRGRQLPATAHKVEAPEVSADIKPTTVIITNPSYQREIAAALMELGVSADLVVA